MKWVGFEFNCNELVRQLYASSYIYKIDNTLLKFVPSECSFKNKKMNDYRNFQRKTRSRKGSNFNNHAKGKQALKHKNNYSIVFSSKYRQIEQSKHGQRYDKFVKKSKKTKHINIHDNLAHGSITRPDNDHKSHEQLTQELGKQVQQKMMGMHVLVKKLSGDSHHTFASIDPLHYLRSPTKTMRLYCVDKTFYFPDMDHSNSGDNVHVKENSKINANEKENNDKKENENIITRMACDIFLYCICDRYLYPNEIFMLLSVSKNIYTILSDNNSNNNNYNYNNSSFLHSIISNQRLIDYLLKLIDSLNDIENNIPQLCLISKVCDEQYEDQDNNVFKMLREQANKAQRELKIGRVKHFRTRVEKMHSICASIISWLGDKSTKKLVIKVVYHFIFDPCTIRCILINIEYF